MRVDEELKIPTELEYIMQACRAVSKNRFQDALFLMKDGLRETSGIAEQMDTSLFIALLRGLLVELELKAEEHYGPLTPREPALNRGGNS